MLKSPRVVENFSPRSRHHINSYFLPSPFVERIFPASIESSKWIRNYLMYSGTISKVTKRHDGMV